MYVAWLEGGTAVFAFRGTESVKDALADLNAVPVQVEWMLHAFPEVMGHSGAPNYVIQCLTPSLHANITFSHTCMQRDPLQNLCNNDLLVPYKL